ncbi:MAG: type II toxin-antitoxin system PemK/MazF family toxin [Bacteroidales bacterium]|jgi:mRNA interferase MazF|nr:type II toxin-antitoxin system PemK/MazF family toxin [Bacteroidales bacterium]
MQKGDIVLIPFPFTDLTGSKNRPALVLAVSQTSITVAFISTQLKWKEETDLVLHPNEENGLKKDSLVRLSKLATLDKDLAIGLLGRIDKHQMDLTNVSLRKIFQL